MKLTIGDEFFAPIDAKMNKNLASKVGSAKDTKGETAKGPAKKENSS